METTVLVVEDEPAIVELVSYSLREAGWNIQSVASAGAAWTALCTKRPQLMLLDWMLPDQSGLRLLSRVRADRNFADIPVIMLTAKSMEEDKLAGLNTGADDYVTKPSSPREILARIRSVLRRRGTGGRAPEASPVVEGVHSGAIDIFAFAGWMLDCRMRVLHAPDGTVIRLTDGEYQLLVAFVSEPQVVQSRDAMIARSGRTESMARGRTIDVNISRLRRKLLAFDPTEIIRTVRGNGYIFMPVVVAK